MFIELPRRRLQFGLRSLLAVITLAALGSWLAGEFNVVQRRTKMRQFLAANAGAVESATKLRAANGELYGPLGPGPPEPVFWRRWMGDEAVSDVLRPYGTSQSQLDRVRAVFPEAHVHACPYPFGYKMRGTNMF
ncbi:MAG TPA: hypothetical protein VG433_10655 [Pirellulales bacterium]|nr:hypothetical protein [Pirellulales bacterium]